ncbi:MAG: hypothetical protein NW218_17210 [Saprospiraceae bacterium]|nr:hypothetical protein [Saprospiraceae bacterium]
MTTAQLKAIEDLLATNRIEDAIEQLRDLLYNTRHHDDVLLQSGRYHQIKREYDGGRLEMGPFSTNSAQIRAALLSIIGDVKKEIARAAPPTTTGNPTNHISELERKGYESQLQLAIQKLQRMESAHLLETDEARKFAYEQQINTLKDTVQDLKAKLNL